MSTAVSATADRWSTRLGVILAVTGSAVGLGNFLRFPGLAAKYEGGAFMVPYFVAFLLLGLPLAWAEWATGRYGGVRGFRSGAGIFWSIWPGRTSLAFGVLALIVPVVISMYYIYIEAWCLGYAWATLSGQLALGPDKAAYVAFFNRFVGAEGHGALLGPAGTPTLVCLATCLVLNLWFVGRGIARGIQRLCEWAMPALVLCALVVLVRVLTLGAPDPQRPELNILNGLGFMWNPHTEQAGFLASLLSAQMWMEAAGQIFFSISVGFGITLTYASYLRQDDDLALSGLTACAGNEFCEVALGGMITIPAAFVFLGAAGVLESAGSTFDLGFKTLPMVFQAMPLGRIVGTLFFVLLFLAAITSSVAMLQPAVALLEEGLGMRRRGAVAATGAFVISGVAVVATLSGNLLALDTLDFWIGTLGIYLLALFQAILFGWILGIDRGMAELRRGAEIRIPRIFDMIIKYVSPSYLIAILGLWLWQQVAASEGNRLRSAVDDPMVALTLLFAGLCFVVVGLVVGRAVRRWRVHGTPRGDGSQAAAGGRPAPGGPPP